jgi:hypothetical protein
MKVNQRKNEYGHLVADCPFCQDFVYLRANTKSSPDPLRDLKRHITNQAKNEAMEWYLAGESIPCPHLEYLKAHSIQKVVQVPKKRQFDGDLQL